MKRDEHETTVTLDYAADTVRFYTTRRGEFNKLSRRLEPVWENVGVTRRRNDGEVVAWDLSIPAEYCTNYLATLTKSANRLSDS